MIRQYARLMLVLATSLVFNACTSNSPKVVAEKFLLAVAKADLDAAKQYCDSNTQELLAQANYLNMVPDSVKAEGRKLKINILDVKENGNKAVVTYNTSKLEEQQMITLVKNEDKWLVQLDKMQSYDDEQPMLTESNELPVDSTINNVVDTVQQSKDSSVH